MWARFHRAHPSYISADRFPAHWDHILTVHIHNELMIVIVIDRAFAVHWIDVTPERL